MFILEEVTKLNLTKDEIKAGGYSDQAMPIIVEQEPGQSNNEMWNILKSWGLDEFR